jgi:3-methyl-2-oxobutanoate hydroxymethyltransferase
VTKSVSIPTIGIGAGEFCDAQILVLHDLIGLSFSRTRPRFVRQYTDVRAEMTEAITKFAEDVRAGAYPAESESYPLPAEARAELEAESEMVRLKLRRSALSDESKC